MKISDITPTEMPSNIGDGDAIIIFKPEGLLVLLPQKYKDVADDKLPKYLIMAMATAYALTDDIVHDYILEHFRKQVKEDDGDDVPDISHKTSYH